MAASSTAGAGGDPEPLRRAPRIIIVVGSRRGLHCLLMRLKERDDDRDRHRPLLQKRPISLLSPLEIPGADQALGAGFRGRSGSGPSIGQDAPRCAGEEERHDGDEDTARRHAPAV